MIPFSFGVVVHRRFECFLSGLMSCPVVVSFVSVAAGMAEREDHGKEPRGHFRSFLLNTAIASESMNAV